MPTALRHRIAPRFAGARSGRCSALRYNAHMTHRRGRGNPRFCRGFCALQKRSAPQTPHYTGDYNGRACSAASSLYIRDLRALQARYDGGYAHVDQHAD